MQSEQLPCLAQHLVFLNERLAMPGVYQEGMAVGALAAFAALLRYSVSCSFHRYAVAGHRLYASYGLHRVSVYHYVSPVRAGAEPMEHSHTVALPDVVVQSHGHSVDSEDIGADDHHYRSGHQ